MNDVILATLTGALRASLMTHSESIGGLRHIQAVAQLRHRPRARGHLPRPPDRAALRDPADRRGPDGPTAPVLLLLPDLQGHRPRGAADRLAGVAASPPRRSAIGSRIARGGGPPRLPLDRRRAGPPITAVRRRARMLRTFPDPPAAAGRPRDRRDIVRRPSSTASPPTATWSPTPTSSVSANQALAELLDTRPAVGRRCPPAAQKAAPKACGSTSHHHGRAGPAGDDGSLPASVEQYITDGDSGSRALMAAAAE